MDASAICLAIGPAMTTSTSIHQIPVTGSESFDNEARRAIDAILVARAPEIAAAGLEAVGPTFRRRGSGQDYSLEATIDFRRSGSFVDVLEFDVISDSQPVGSVEQITARLEAQLKDVIKRASDGREA